MKTRATIKLNWAIELIPYTQTIKKIGGNRYGGKRDIDFDFRFRWLIISFRLYFKREGK